MVWDFFRRKETPRVAEPLWAEALGGAGGPSAPVLMFVLDSRYIPALDIALRQRSLAPVEGPQLRWAGPMRSAMAVPLRRGGYDLVALVGHRMEDLAQGLRLEAGLPSGARRGPRRRRRARGGEPSRALVVRRPAVELARSDRQ
ncbi:MAG: hypothetical protein IPN01_14420 [Deltaproteobacteria bacterium]|nr:hypothetical protein [Deltaproteobacteria bacterium]